MIDLDVRPFDALSVRDVYDMLALRARVFVVEQESMHVDPDGLDRSALHVFGTTQREGLVAYARILEPGAGRFMEPAIGRVIVAAPLRGRGLSRVLMRRAIAASEAAHGPLAIALAAQLHLEPLYASLGFVRRGEPYADHGIPHLDMLRPPA